MAMRIYKDYRKKGVFWIPSKEKTKVPCILHFKDGGIIELELMGAFLRLYGDDVYHIKRIFGYLEPSDNATGSTISFVPNEAIPPTDPLCEISH